MHQLCFFSVFSIQWQRLKSPQMMRYSCSSIEMNCSHNNQGTDADQCLIQCHSCSTWLSTSEVICGTCSTKQTLDSPPAVTNSQGKYGSEQDNTNTDECTDTGKGARSTNKPSDIVDLTQTWHDDNEQGSSDCVIADDLVDDEATSEALMDGNKACGYNKTLESPYRCALCGMTFTLPHILTEHMCTHTGDTSYACYVCERAFSKKSSLKRHMVTHRGARDYVCQICGEAFTLPWSLKEHCRLHPVLRRLTLTRPNDLKTQKQVIVQRDKVTSHMCVPINEDRKGATPSPPGGYIKPMPPLERIVSRGTLPPSPHTAPTNHRRKSQPRKLVTVVTALTRKLLDKETSGNNICVL